ncbi:glutathione s-transferase [Moniliophthora roreri MCA 2997]|uniref:Glutathione s-transferase n=1 Tax=Moniliophthora roreri (strain MCA 2997) TaxID=1381753 RepID=V2WNS8_MONRO|nr:glutathione s-transferase [Moniliophthora roreri MCA 2997]
MPTTIIVPDGLPLVGASLLSTVVLLIGQSIVVGRHRKAAKIAYPQLYAEKAQEEASLEAKKFNCAQRAHQNTLENIPIVWLTTCIAAVKYPILAASLTGLWSLSRYFYTRGYVTGDPTKRLRGGYLGSLTVLGLLGSSFYIVGKGVMEYLGF